LVEQKKIVETNNCLLR